MKFINLDFSKLSPEVVEIIQNCFRNLNIPITPTEARIDQLQELAFMGLLIEAIQLANIGEIPLARRREIMAEMILLDERINKKSQEMATAYISQSDKAYLN